MLEMARMLFSLERMLIRFETILKDFIKRLNIALILVNKDLSEIERKKYKYHLLRCNGEYEYVPLHQQESFIKNLTLTDFERTNEYKLVDIHVDFNPSEGTLNERGISKNKSNLAYRAYVPWLRGCNFRVFSKPIAWAATSAADLLLQD